MQIFHKGKLISDGNSHSRIILTSGEGITIEKDGLSKPISISVNEKKISIHHGCALIKEIEDDKLK